MKLRVMSNVINYFNENQKSKIGICDLKPGATFVSKFYFCNIC